MSISGNVGSYDNGTEPALLHSQSERLQGVARLFRLWRESSRLRIYRDGTARGARVQLEQRWEVPFNQYLATQENKFKLISVEAGNFDHRGKAFPPRHACRKPKTGGFKLLRLPSLCGCLIAGCRTWPDVCFNRDDAYNE
jgi:hypothetical protein